MEKYVLKHIKIGHLKNKDCFFAICSWYRSKTLCLYFERSYSLWNWKESKTNKGKV